MWPWFIALVLLVGILGLSVYVLVELPGWLRRKALPYLPPMPRLSTTHATGYVEGEDLLRYPQRLEALERQLADSLGQTVDQQRHLEARRDEVKSKEGRDELAARYDEDASLLGKRAERMRRVLGLVWKTRAVLTIRAHVAVTARRRPDLSQLPDPDSEPARLDVAENLYRGASDRVREFVSRVEDRLNGLGFAVPRPMPEADVGDELYDEVRAEEQKVRDTYGELRERMDRLADTLAYLADRCHTRQVVEDAPQGLDAAVGSGALLDQVADALSALNDLSQAGDRRLADLAVDNLAEDIGHLERAGLEAQAEAEAALEVERLLEQFQG